MGIQILIKIFENLNLIIWSYSVPYFILLLFSVLARALAGASLLSYSILGPAVSYILYSLYKFVVFFVVFLPLYDRDGSLMVTIQFEINRFKREGIFEFYNCI